MMIGSFHSRLTDIAVAIFTYILINDVENITVAGKSCHCLTHWEEFGNHCYRLFDDGVPFQTAQVKCNSFSRGTRTAYVASALSAEENEFLGEYTKRIMGRNVGQWIGLKYNDDVGDYTWLDGSPVVYTNWQTGHHPNSTAMACVKRKGTHVWVTWPCEETKRFVCKISKRPPLII